MTREQLDHFPVKGRDVIGLAAGDEIPINDDLFVDPSRPSVAEIGL